MKIVMINGQNHKGSTYHIGRLLAEKLADNAVITEFFLPRDLNHFCLGCYQCIEDVEKCPFYSEKKPILDAMEDADMLIFTTPNYCFGPSAQMKALIDLFFDFWMSHRPLPWIFKKKAVVISTCAGGGANSAAKQVQRALFYMGVPYIRRYAVAVQAMNWEMVKPEKKQKIEADMQKLANNIGKIGTPKAGLKSRLLFKLFSKMHDSGWDSSPVEKQYWIEQGWLGK
ncbi:MAG TPA: NAD(P)H-dependent oxidoreductase [Lachnospiraceae bacterium]|nr:NAD(P)H-dependent oxidoreductase [Lachnospiraceae bacterium]